MKVSFYFFVLLLFFPLAIWSQPLDLRFQHINKSNGLSHNFTRSIIRDFEGYMWFGTADGLNRYDGYTMRVYKKDAMINSLSSSDILRLFEDSKHNLWVGTGAGLNLYNRDKDVFERYATLQNEFINAIYEDRKHALWVSTKKGLYQFNETKKAFEAFDLGTQVNVLELLEDSRGRFWIGLSDGLALLDRTQHSLQRFEEVNVKVVSAILEDTDKDIWIGSKGSGLLKWEGRSKRFIQYEDVLKQSDFFAGNFILALHEDAQKNILIGTQNGGLYIYDPHRNKFERYVNNPYNEESLGFNSVGSIYVDRDDNVWLGLLTGVDLVKRNKFKHIRPEAFNVNGLSSKNILSFCEDHRGNIFIGTDGGGLELYNSATGIFKHYKHSDKDKNSVATNAITCVYEDHAKNIWVGTWGGGLDMFDQKKNRFIHFNHAQSDASSIQDGNVIKIYEDHLNNLWIGTGKGIDCFDRDAKKFVHYNGAGAVLNSYPGDLMEDRAGNFWVGAYDGLCILDRNSKKVLKEFKHNDHDVSSISNNIVHTLFEDGKGNLWIGTGDGLNCYQPGTGKFKSYHEEDGLPNDVIYGILEDKNGYLWLTTANGVSRFDPNKIVFKNYNVDDGLQGMEFRHNAFCELKNGEMLFGGDNGFNIFNPIEIKDNFIVPPVVLTDFKIFNKSVLIGAKDSPLEKQISQTHDLKLSYKNSVISFEFAAIAVSASSGIQYAYKLDGFEDEWNYVGNKREATYTSLDPGNYTFRVIASNNDGIWNREGVALRLTIVPPVWETWWFRSICVLMFAALIHVFVRIRINRYKRQKKVLELIVERKTREIVNKNYSLEAINHELSQQKEEILEMSLKVKEADERKLNFFKNISHEFRTPLTLILGPLRTLIERSDNATTTNGLNVVYRNAQRLLFLLNELMDFYKLDNNEMKLHVSKCDIIKFFSEIVYSFEELAAQKEIELSFLPSLPHYETWLDTQKVEIILYNLVSNAFKFTHEGGSIKLKLLVSEDGGKIEMAVEDNGIGIDEDKIKNIFNRYYQIDAPNGQYQGTGIGLAHTRELVELMEGNITVISKQGKGTAFIINLPIITDAKVKNNGKIVMFNDSAIAINKDLFSALNSIEKPKDFVHQDDRPLPEILVIDDNEDIRLYIEVCLEDKFRVIQAENGKDGLAILNERHPTLVICDVMMPVLNGFEFCAAVKKHIETSHIPVVLLTAKANSESQVEGFQIGADDYLTKPFTKELLVSRVENLVKNREQLRSVYKTKIDFEPREVSVTSADESFLLNALEIIEKYIDDSNFGAEELVRELGISRSVVHRKFKELTDLATGEFIKTTRLKRACQLLKERKHRISEVCYMVGFSDPHYFRKSFKNLYGVSPSHYHELEMPEQPDIKVN
jgi:signal transduction histidine kinase/ligand-binding sensor domain-containing protein/AraC-like DNA-binding protein/AmiR/NasT family two-component response regulator